MKRAAVLSRYKEKNDLWQNMAAQNGYEIIIYNKYEGQNLLPNVGREGHTYIHYIIKNYHDLPDEILFSQYDPRDHFSAYKQRSSEAMESILAKNVTSFCGIKATNFDLIVRRRKIDWEGFFKSLFGKEDEKEKIKELLGFGSTLNGIFKTTKQAILKHDISFYRKALEMLSKGSDPDEGYFFERIWKYLFLEKGCKNKAFENLNEEVLLFGTMDTTEISARLMLKNYNYGHLKLSKDGTVRSNSGNVSYYSHYNESFWVIKENFLYLLDACGGTTSRFNLLQDEKILKGDQSLPNGKWRENYVKLSPPFMWY